ncbi:MAG TPA: cell division protein FtsL [Smithella sp.]|nr:cell division protein FtsL [Smithella sp.]MDM7986283.1 cell division protein FtsL [Smithella sp.]HNY49576.1 cell division protein FtsL [Smithella sp.]HOG89349.1 cell division protein FtsL [Smithella sp.]HOU50117.1 cell division protein FtsL [Smithella sp.]
MTQSAQSVETRVMPHLKEAGEASLGIKYPTFIVFAIVLMMVALIYVGSHIRMTELEYNIAAELSAQQQMLEEQKKLKLEYAMLKSPQRIESIVSSKLQMTYPDNSQVIVLKQPGE